jgi:hypothetical protein
MHGDTDMQTTSEDRLLAAAPDLLAVLERINDAWNGPSMEPAQFYREVMAVVAPDMRAAIAKARSAGPSPMLAALQLAEPILAGCDSGGMSCGRELAAVRAAIVQATGGAS